LLGIDADRLVAVFVGALGDRRKGFDLLFDAWVALCRDPSWDVDLAVAGTGAELAAWRRRAAERGSAGRITFLGFRRDIARVLAAADVIVHPSRYEAYGLGVHEALCRGLPAIVPAEAGVAERLPSTLAPLILRGGPSVETLVDALRRWRADEKQWRAEAMRFSTGLRERSWDDMAADVAAIVERL
jgi:glycosyltransferase involved in cell wall biosynthesis